MPSFPGGRHRGGVLPLDRSNVDTDAIFPKQYGRSTARSGYGAVLFDNWRYLDPGDLDSDHRQRRPNPDFVLNDPRRAGATVLLARENFGCGSSREAAVWALRDYGIRAVLAVSFGDIFRQNCPLNGVAAIALPAHGIDRLMGLSALPVMVEIDVLAGTLQTVSASGAGLPGPAFSMSFALPERDRLLLTQDIDWIAATLSRRELVARFETERLARLPWLAHTLPGGGG